MIRISLKHISKKFLIGGEKKKGFLKEIISALSGREQKKEILVLNDLSLEVHSGTILGIIGKNGSGKSTLLRIMASIYFADQGTVTMNGKVISIIHLGTAFKERLTMKENIFLVGSLFSMSQREIQQRFDEIVRFSELQDFINTKIYQFSAGMLQRLAFSIAIYSEPNILLLDEVFEVGDESFRKKSAAKIKDLVTHGTTVVLVTHDLEMLRKQCEGVIWLADGKIKMQGTPEDILYHYVR
jgi:ABC-type polysaccharide/polyol phosphate transport system ATPase subunit